MVAKPKRGLLSAQDRLAGLFEPDVLLPAQFFAAFRRMGGLDRERLLMLAVLEDAVDCYQKYALAKDPRGRQLFGEAKEWVDSGDKTWLFSFENICDTLEIDASYVRRGLLRWRDHQRGRTGRPRVYALRQDQSAAASTGDALRKVSA
jgi:hypothetical protein